MELSENQKLSEEIHKIAQMYFLALKADKNDEETNLKNSLFIKKVENAFACLDGLEKSFINNEFFYQNYSEWWKNHFSRSSYYRLKRASMMHFKMAFEHED